MKNMRVLIDTNVILDWVMYRTPFCFDAERIIEMCFLGDIEGYLTAHSMTDFFYILRKDLSVAERKEFLLLLCKYFHIITEDKITMIVTLSNDAYNDFEDGLQMTCASRQFLNYIVTRNTSDFENSQVPAILPEKFLNIMIKS